MDGVDIEAVVAAYGGAEEPSLKQVADRFKAQGLTPTRVRSILTLAQVALRPRGGKVKKVNTPKQR